MNKCEGANCEECPFKEQKLVMDRGVQRENERLDLLFIGEAPGKTEVLMGKPFVGRSGELLNRVLDPLMKGKSYWITNAALCFDPTEGDTKSKSPVNKAALCCHYRLDNLIVAKNPRVIVTLGNVSSQLLVGTKEGITKLRGRVRKYGFDMQLMPTYHPAAILRNISLYQDFVSDIRRAIQCVANPEDTVPNNVPFTLTVDFARVFATAEAAQFAVLDLETTGLDFTRDHIICYTVATSTEVFIMPEMVRTLDGFLGALRNCKARWVGHNAKFDRNFMLFELGVPVHFAYDTMLAHYLLDERGGVHGLKEICASLYGAPDWEASLKTQLKLRKSENYDDVPKETLYTYAAMDGYWTARLMRTLYMQLNRYPKLKQVMTNIMIPATEAFSNAETRGILFDPEANKTAKVIYTERAGELRQQLIAIAGKDFNPNSPKQTSYVLYNICHVPPVLRAEGSTDTKMVLIKRRGYPIVDTLIAYRGVNTLLTRYVTGLANNLGADNRIHTSYLLHGTTTGRLSSSPNLQNMPRTALDIKAMFVASPGYAFIHADYSQLELRCIAWLSDDEFLLDCYRNNVDLHGAMAEVLFGAEYSKEQRNLAKRLDFGLVYGRSVAAIADDGLVVMDAREAQRIQNLFFSRMPRVVSWIQEIHDLVQVQQWVESPLGRRRRFPIIPGDRQGEQEVYRQAVNFLPQSMASDATTCAFIKLDKAGLRPLISVHDSILCEVPEEGVEDSLAQLVLIMESTGAELYGTKVPFTVEGSKGKKWSEL